MNTKLKFTYGHIIAFIALIFICYITFLGITYLTDGDFMYATIGVLGIALLFFLLLMKIQGLKATDRYFDKGIILERVLLIMFGLLTCAAFIPFSHFWTIQSAEKEFVGDFKQKVKDTRKIFDEYEKYANARIDLYNLDLNRVVDNKKNKPLQYKEYGFLPEFDDKTQVNNLNENLKLILLSENYSQVKREAHNWLEDADRWASVWNVFLLGNIKKINASASVWIQKLVGMSEDRAPNENANPFNYSISFSELNDFYVQYSFPSILSIILGLISYSLLLAPYMIQTRHTRSTYTLRGNQQSANTSGTFTLED